MASHKYENVHLPLTSDEHEHDHSSRSSTEVESLMGEEKSWQAQQRKSKRRTLGSILKSSRWMLDTTLLLIIVALLVRNEVKEPATEQWQTVGDMTGVGPRCLSTYFLSGTMMTQKTHAELTVHHSPYKAYPLRV